MKGYKGFSKGLVCRGKQYEENTVFEEAKAEICMSGMHFCENPFNVLDHYGFVNEKGEFNEFCEVEVLDDVSTDDNKKYCTTKLKIGAKLSFSGFVKACVDFAIEQTKVKGKENTADDSVISSKASSAKIGSSGGYAQIGSSGDSAKIGSSGDSAKIGSSGGYAQINSEGELSVICCAGHNSVVKAKKGSWITLSEWEWKGDKYTPICVRTEYVDGENIKADTWYKLVGGKFVEVRL
ncbi:MAG: hypothetical protein J6L85_02950 [Clostridia bacterium]|nr:hypothetical protein [Clostridia bacterium]